MSVICQDAQKSLHKVCLSKPSDDTEKILFWLCYLSKNPVTKSASQNVLGVVRCSFSYASRCLDIVKIEAMEVSS